ncbi:MAG: hypothetical protein CO108_02370 [Deltaproteobacteria bacterium CG_4_9_14_3_um_filter_63_12]|nr:MAG: hypothetical protein CO108_02370 [Deltaproteobacteria bacterium CG_4_9_14_3_um_filter_63_12]
MKLQTALLTAFLVLLVLHTGCGDNAKSDPKGSDDDLRPSDVANGDLSADAVDADPDQSETTLVTDTRDAFVLDATDVGECTPGEVMGCAADDAVFVCQPDGASKLPEDCPTGLHCMGGYCNDYVCMPNQPECADGSSIKTCNADGSAYGAPVACPAATVCSDRYCHTPCEYGKYVSSYIGCEYWTLDLDNYHDPMTNPKPDEVPHSVVISNPHGAPATVIFQSPAVGVSINVPDPIVPARSAKAFQMPRLDISGTAITSNSINILSSIPVSVHQFNPLENVAVFSNDASLLLPRNVLGQDYYVVGWPTAPLPCISPEFCPDPQHGYVTMLATELGTTTVTIKPAARIQPGVTLPGWAAGIPATFTLNFGEVLNLEALDPNLFNGFNDLTGTHITSDKPIAVFTGHEEAVVAEEGVDACCADHLEEQLFPVNTWANEYIAALSPGRGVKNDYWFIVSAMDGNVITTNPPQPDANGIMLNAGQFVTFFSDQNFEVQGTGKLSVAQLLVSGQATSEGSGDPALVLAVPTARYRSDYALLTPAGFTTNYVTITRQPGVEVRIDGVAVSNSFTSIGSGAWETAGVSVNVGSHSLEGDGPFGIVAYGFGPQVSYAYPGGLNFVGSESTP